MLMLILSTASNLYLSLIFSEIDVLLFTFNINFGPMLILSKAFNRHSSLISTFKTFDTIHFNPNDTIYPTPPLGQDMTQGQFLSGV